MNSPYFVPGGEVEYGLQREFLEFHQERVSAKLVSGEVACEIVANRYPSHGLDMDGQASLDSYTFVPSLHSERINGEPVRMLALTAIHNFGYPVRRYSHFYVAHITTSLFVEPLHENYPPLSDAELTDMRVPIAREEVDAVYAAALEIDDFLQDGTLPFLHHNLLYIVDKNASLKKSE